MSDVLAAAPATSAPARRKQPYAFGLASLVLGSVVWLAYGAMVATVALLVLAVPGWLALLIELTQATGVPFVVLTGGPWAYMFAVMGVAGIVGMIAFVVYVCATALGVVAVVYGVVALVQREKRAFAISGILLSAAVLVVNVVVPLLVFTPAG